MALTTVQKELGGTGTTTSTGTGSVVLSNSPTLVTPALGIPASVTLTNATGLPLSTGVTGTLPLATGVSGTLPVANGGTGTATPSLVGGTNITISGSFPNQTVTAAGGGVTSLNGQTGAITNTGSGDIGSYTAGIRLGANVTTNRGDTIAGSSLYVIASNANDNGTTPFDMRYRGSTYTYTNPFSGTWRAMNLSKNEPTQCCGNYLRAPNLWVRIS